MDRNATICNNNFRKRQNNEWTKTGQKHFAFLEIKKAKRKNTCLLREQKQCNVLGFMFKKVLMDDFTSDTDIFSEINDAPGEIFDIPEMSDDPFSVEDYFKSNIDF